jgi:FkbM family methyltransferase
VNCLRRDEAPLELEATVSAPLKYSLNSSIMITKLNSKLQVCRLGLANAGLIPLVAWRWQKLRARYFSREKLTLSSRYAKFPLYCRPGTSDIDVFHGIFISREYRCLDNNRDVELIIDCGANAGYSSAYFLSRFSNASVIAIEPDPENFAMLEANLAPYAGRFRALRSAVWSRQVGLVISELPFGDGREWARTVRETRTGEEPAMVAIDIGTLFKESGYDRISILKVDIEGAESIVFSSNYETWIGKVDTIVIELHNETCEAVFRNAICNLNVEMSRCDELTVCKKAGPPSQTVAPRES